MKSKIDENVVEKYSKRVAYRSFTMNAILNTFAQSSFFGNTLISDPTAKAVWNGLR